MTKTVSARRKPLFCASSPGSALAHIDWWKEAAHDRVNYAITKADVILDGHDTRGTDAGAFVLKLTLRSGITSAGKEITTLYGKRFHACGRAAQIWLQLPYRVQRRALHVRQGDEGLVPNRHLRRADGLKHFANSAMPQEIDTFPEFAGKTCQIYY